MSKINKTYIIGSNYCQLLKIIVFPNRLGGEGAFPLYSCSQHPSGVSKNNNYQQLPIIGSENYPYYPPDPYSKLKLLDKIIVNYWKLLFFQTALAVKEQKNNEYY